MNTSQVRRGDNAQNHKRDLCTVFGYNSSVTLHTSFPKSRFRLSRGLQQILEWTRAPLATHPVRFVSANAHFVSSPGPRFLRVPQHTRRFLRISGRAP